MGTANGGPYRRRNDIPRGTPGTAGSANSSTQPPWPRRSTAEVVDPADESDPARGPESPRDEMRYPEAGDEANGDMPRDTGLMTLEEAAEAEHAARRLHRPT